MDLQQPPFNAEQQWHHEWQVKTKRHFECARDRVDAVYTTHFASLPNVCRRHWQYRSDIPKDLLNLPRGLWRLCTVWRRGTRAPISTPTGKENALIKIIDTELLQIDQLRIQYHQHIQTHPAFEPELQYALEKALSGLSPAHAQQKLQTAIERLRLSHEGTRDLFLFVSLGLISRGLADKIAFGGAAVIGSTLATSAYVSQQTWLNALWINWFGAPSWVTATGAAGGIGAILITTPLISPLAETGINRLRAKKVLHQIVNELELKTQHAHFDAASSAGQVATYLQLLPDLVQMVKQLR